MGTKKVEIFKINDSKVPKLYVYEIEVKNKEKLVEIGNKLPLLWRAFLAKDSSSQV
ncbi:MAG: hypothetical protein ACK4VK_06090 [Aquificaceae bacterium]